MQKQKNKIKRKHYILQVYVNLLSLQRRKKALIFCPLAALQGLITAIHTKQAWSLIDYHSIYAHD